MSRRSIRSFFYALVCGAAIAAGAAGFAGASSIESMLDGALQPSAAPGLLGPITESGRTGWACKPEQAAGSKDPTAAQTSGRRRYAVSMRGTHAALALSLLLAAGAAARAQEYPSASPVPRTTSMPALHAIARTREVHERFVRGVAAEQRGDWASAAPEFERIVSLHPDEPQFSTAHYDLGIAYANLGRLDQAAGAFEDALQGDPGFLAAMANLIAVDLSRGNVTQARKIADRFIAAAPDSARALYSRGIIALRSGDFSTARNDFSQLLRSDPQYALAHYNLGIAQTRLGDYNSAEHEFSVALDLAPSYARARFALGTVLLREGKRNQARDAFEQVVRDSNGDPALANLALAMRDAIHAP